MRVIMSRPAPKHVRKDVVHNHAALLEAARAVFADQGLDAPLDLIAEKAGVGRGTLYRHFADRTELARRLRKRALKDNRFDDANEAVIQNRFATYEAETKPILEHYGEKRVIQIDASQAPAKVLYDILGGIMTLDEWKELEKMKI